MVLTSRNYLKVNYINLHRSCLFEKNETLVDQCNYKTITAAIAIFSMHKWCWNLDGGLIWKRNQHYFPQRFSHHANFP